MLPELFALVGIQLWPPKFSASPTRQGCRRGLFARIRMYLWTQLNTMRKYQSLWHFRRMARFLAEASTSAELVFTVLMELRSIHTCDYDKGRNLLHVIYVNSNPARLPDPDTTTESSFRDCATCLGTRHGCCGVVTSYLGLDPVDEETTLSINLLRSCLVVLVTDHDLPSEEGKGGWLVAKERAKVVQMTARADDSWRHSDSRS
ncbi:hypothetical protein B0H14DRAFT_2576900 [Mycena olivaceomarginata]|nr:hypothetical protein B0H14DRAFT_2576900 [Mycena olivaceomarginata]